MDQPDTAARRPLLTVLGWRNGESEHWQHVWACADPAVRRVSLPLCHAPLLADWVWALARATDRCDTAPILVAHDTGCLAVVHYAQWCAGAGGGWPDHRVRPARVAGALLVAPVDVEREDAPPAVRAFAPVPLSCLPFPSVVIASRNDPHLAMERAATFAAAWGSTLIDAGAAGHLHRRADLGAVARGSSLLTRLALSRC
ncbi:MAG: RBBP9/YdeN family alpha/beta hydrolase [Gemmatimonadaceae bacterium]